MTQQELDELQAKTLEQFKSGKPLFGESGAFAPMLKQFLEAALQAEMDAHLSERQRQGGNKRNGKGMAAEEAGDCPECRAFWSNLVADVKANWDSFKEGVTEYVFDKNTQVAEQTSYTKTPNEKNLIKNAGYQTANVVDNTQVLPYVSASVSKADGLSNVPAFATVTWTPYGNSVTVGPDATLGIGPVPVSVSAGFILKSGGPVLPSDVSGLSGTFTSGVGIGFEASSSFPGNTIQLGLVVSPNMWIGANAGGTTTPVRFPY